MGTDTACNHKWKKAGLWDGKDPNTGQKTGGIIYKYELRGKSTTTSCQFEPIGLFWQEFYVKISGKGVSL
jgi:hypothetical protein